MDLRGGECAQENPNAIGNACPLDGRTLNLVAVFRLGNFADGAASKQFLFVEDILSRRFSRETMQLSLAWSKP